MSLERARLLLPLLTILAAGPAVLEAQLRPVTAQIMVSEETVAGNVIRVMDTDGVVLTPSLPLLADPLIWQFSVSDDGQSILYVTGHDGIRVGHLWKHDIATGTSTHLFDVAGNASNLRWLPNDPNRFLFSAADQGIFVHDLAAGSTTLWQSTDPVMQPYGKSYRNGLDWDGSFTTFAFQAGTPYGAGDRVFVGTYVDRDGGHIGDIVPLTADTNSDANGAGNPRLSRSGEFVYYVRRSNWTQWSLVRQRLATGDTVELVSRTQPYGIWHPRLFDQDRQVAFIDSQGGSLNAIVVCDLASAMLPVPCRTIYTSAYWISDMQVVPAPDEVPPDVTATPSTTVMWPPDGSTRLISVTGVATDEGVGPASHGVYSVTDKYGQTQPQGTFEIDKSGNFNFQVGLVASRLGGDRDGRLYRVTVTVGDKNGNQGLATIEIVVPHDQRR